MAENIEQIPEDNSQAPNISDILSSTLRHWKWIIVSVVLCVGFALFHAMRSQPVYVRTASIVIKEDSKGRSIAADFNAFSDMGLIGSGKTNVNDEINKLTSYDVVTEVVNRLDLMINYTQPGTFHPKVLYGSSLPIKVSLPSLLPDETASATINIDKNGNYTITNIFRDGEQYPYDQGASAKLDSTLTTPLGAVTVNRTAYYTSGKPLTINISKSPLIAAVSATSAKLNVSRLNDKGNTIDITVKDTNPQRAEDIINDIISVYNEVWIENRNQISVSTSRFITERLNAIEKELGNVDQDISSYQSEHLIPDVQQAATMYMTENQQAKTEILKLNNILQMTRYMRDFIMDSNNRNEVLPANTGIDDSSIEGQITEYNNAVMKRNQLVRNSSVSHPKVMNLDIQIASMRTAILSAIDNQIRGLETQIKSLQGTKNQTTAQIAANPTQAKYLLSVERQQKVKEALYLFLLQKREENELSQAFTAYNTQVITRPHGPAYPIAPRKAMIVFCALIVGILIPFAVTFALEALNTKVRGRKDIEKLTVPYLGEIPRMKTKKGATSTFVVKQGNRNTINEAFRVIRTNLGFVSDKDKANVIMVTSFNAGSGKTFITLNLGLALAIRDSKVLIIDGDMRHASTSEVIGSPNFGLADYLAGKTDDVDRIIVKTEQNSNLSILPVGTIPPNPTELLESQRFADLIETMKKHYDYIFIDCPPAETMADAQIVDQYADRTIFIIRAGLFERSMLPEVNRIYITKKFKNLSIILNATAVDSSRYGYKYGYGYGYGYGYYNDSNNDDSSSK